MPFARMAIPLRFIATGEGHVSHKRSNMEITNLKDKDLNALNGLFMQFLLILNKWFEIHLQCIYILCIENDL